VGQVQATDAENDPLYFKLVLGNAKFAFAINSSSGQLTVNNKDALDYERQNEFQLKVEIDDGEFKAQADVVVTINNQETEFGNYNPRIYEKEGASLPYQILYPNITMKPLNFLFSSFCMERVKGEMTTDPS